MFQLPLLYLKFVIAKKITAAKNNGFYSTVSISNPIQYLLVSYYKMAEAYQCCSSCSSCLNQLTSFIQVLSSCFLK